MIKFQAELWIWRAENGVGWHFLTLPEAARDALKASIKGTPKKGFGSVKVNVTIGKTDFQTSLFPAKEYGSYLLPVKATVRKAGKLVAGDLVAVTLEVV
ncbi:MAG: DUF1905 domain-containing protein [Armatimonadota bacterium]